MDINHAVFEAFINNFYKMIGWERGQNIKTQTIETSDNIQEDYSDCIVGRTDKHLCGDHMASRHACFVYPEEEVDYSLLKGVESE
jgi:hypothetical protein